MSNPKKIKVILKFEQKTGGGHSIHPCRLCRLFAKYGILKTELLVHNVLELFTLQIPFQVIQEKLGDTTGTML